MSSIGFYRVHSWLRVGVLPRNRGSQRKEMKRRKIETRLREVCGFPFGGYLPCGTSDSHWTENGRHLGIYARTKDRLRISIRSIRTRIEAGTCCTPIPLSNEFQVARSRTNNFCLLDAWPGAYGRQKSWRIPETKNMNFKLLLDTFHSSFPRFVTSWNRWSVVRKALHVTRQSCF